MRILQVNKFNYIRGGAEKYFIELSSELEKAGHQVAVFSMHHPKNIKSNWDKYFVSRISFNEIKLRDRILAPFRILYGFEAKRKFEKLIKDFKPDIVHIHNIYHQISPSILPVAKKYKIPVIMHLHDYKLICPNYQLFVDNQICYRCRGGKYYNCTKHLCFKKSLWQSLLASLEMYFHHKILNIYQKNIDLFIAPSKFMKKTVIDFGIDEKKVEVVYNFSDFTEKEKAEEEKYGLYFGRLSKEKGIDVLLKSLNCVKGDLKIKIAGSGPEEESLKITVKDLGLENKVDFLGYRSGADLKKIIGQAKFIVMPSVWAENMPLSLIEALQAGKIVIASSTGGMPELVKNEETGFLFENGNSQDLAEKINKIIDGVYDLEKIKKQAQKRVEELNVRNHLLNILEIYEKHVK